MRRALPLAVLALAGCGGGTPRPLSTAAWVANARILVAQLQRDLLLAAAGGSTVASADRTLHDGNRLYTVLVAYTDFGGCASMFANVGAPPGGLGRANADVDAACGYLQRSARLFTRATTNHDPRALVAAGRTSLKAEPYLYRAKSELRS